jgi:omega-hydroxy-beta-dihydromenaquinone-9 sulfotransferase
MWKNAILKFYSLQSISDAELDDIIFGHFDYLIGQYEKDRKRIPEGNLIEISYEELTADPFNTLHRIYSALDLPDFDSTIRDLRLQLEAESKYQNFRYQVSRHMSGKIEERWGKYIRQGNYDAH